MRASGLNGLDLWQQYVVESADAEGEIRTRLPTQSMTAGPTDGLEPKLVLGSRTPHRRHYCSIIDAVRAVGSRGEKGQIGAG